MHGLLLLRTPFRPVLRHRARTHTFTHRHTHTLAYSDTRRARALAAQTRRTHTHVRFADCDRAHAFVAARVAHNNNNGVCSCGLASSAPNQQRHTHTYESCTHGETLYVEYTYGAYGRVAFKIVRACAKVMLLAYVAALCGSPQNKRTQIQCASLSVCVILCHKSTLYMTRASYM